MELESDNRPLVGSIQALRGMLCIAIVLSHTGFDVFRSLGKFGVEVFFVLSGCMMVYSYYGRSRIRRTSCKDNLMFACKKISRLYGLYVFTTFLMLVFFFVGKGRYTVKTVVIRLVLNLLLIQEWIPLKERSINGVSWYLSAAAFCYFVFPWILLLFEKKMTRGRAITSIGITYIVKIVTECLAYFMVGELSLFGELRYNDCIQWVCYTHPLSRLIDFYAGCCVGYICLCKGNHVKKVRQGILDVISIGMVLMSNYIYIQVAPTELVLGNTDEAYLDIWWTYSILFFPVACLVVERMMNQESNIVHLFTNTFTVRLGNISQYVFLIHYVVFIYISGILRGFIGNDFNNMYSKWIKISIGVVITAIFVKWWIKTEKNS